MTIDDNVKNLSNGLQTDLILFDFLKAFNQVLDTIICCVNFRTIVHIMAFLHRLIIFYLAMSIFFPLSELFLKNL